MKKYLIVFVTVMLFSPLVGARGVYISSKGFIEGAFSGAAGAGGGNVESEKTAGKSTLKVIRLTPESQREIKQILGKPYPAKRIRYWKRGERSAWIIDQIGKTEPITVGVVVEQGKILELKILVFRESRGAEVRHSFFTDQFLGLNLNPSKKLSDYVDGITGATLSVIAVKKVARLALYLDQFASSIEPKSVGLLQPSR